MLNPRIDTVVRTHSEEDAVLLQNEHARKVFMGEHELALAVAHQTLEKVADGTGTAADQIRQI